MGEGVTRAASDRLISHLTVQSHFGVSMTRRTRLAALAVLSATVALVPAYAADEPKPAAPAAAAPAAEEGFTPLFNGKDFTGWVYGKAGADGKENKAGK